MTEYIYKLVNSKKELQGAYKVRKQVFVIEQGISEDLVFESTGDSTGIDIVVKDKETVVGTLRVVFSVDNTAKIERMAVLQNYRQKGIGGNIIKFLHKELRYRRIKHVFLHAQHQVVPFYKSCGFEEIDIPFKEAGLKHIKMEMYY